jgi:hypothetical protein
MVHALYASQISTFSDSSTVVQRAPYVLPLSTFRISYDLIVS